MNILVIGYCFPPTVSPEAFVTAKLLRHIPNCTVDMVTLEDGAVSGLFDEEMGQYAAGINGKIHHIKINALHRKLLSLPRLPLRPDRWTILTNKVVAQIKALIAQNNYDILVTRSQYHSAHLAGLKLKTLFPNLPWCACFSDPWSATDHQHGIPVFSAWSKIQEKKVIQAADRLVFPTEGIEARMLAHDITLREKSVVIPHAFDEALYPEHQRKKDDGIFRLRLFGSFYHARQPQTLIDAVAMVALPCDKSLSVEIYGGFHPAWKDVGKRSKGRITWKGSVPHRQALALMRESDLLVVVDAVQDGRSIYLPSKLVDYIGANTNILALCGKGCVADITRSLGGLVVDGRDAPAIAKAIEQAVNQGRKSLPEQDRQMYRVETIGRDFGTLLEQMIDVNA